MNGPMLEAAHLSVRFGETAALNDVSFACGPGEFIGITGKNGSGKTTLMRVLSGQCLPRTGEVRFRGCSIYGSANTAYKHSLGFVHENPFLYPYLTVENMIHFVVRIKSGLDRFDKAEADRVLDIVSLSDQRHMLVSDLSMGMKRRLALGLALIGRPAIIFLDEPFVNIDFENLYTIKDALTAFVRDGGCVLLSTHILDTAEKLCSRILLLAGGKSVCDLRGTQLSRRLAAAGGHLEQLLLAIGAGGDGT
ncbi:ABC transporter ATP-binding protein [bacterium]|nr:ABC transporter ATP-binding protein [bacterium]